ncbi:unnamed protein product [Closterium sp. NIES-53]
MASEQQASAEGMAVEGAEDEGEADLAATTSMEAAGVADTAATTRATDAVANGQEGREARGGRGRGRGGRGGRGGGAANMRNGDNESESRVDRFPDQFFFMSTQAPAAPEKDEIFEEPTAVGKVTLHSLDYWVIDSGATYSMTPRADLLTELEPSQVKHVTSALGQRAEVKGMGKAMFKDADGKMVGLKNGLWVPNLAANLISVRRLQKAGMDTSSKGAKTYTARLGERILWDLHDDRVKRKLGEHEESGAAAEKQHKGEENPKAAAEEEYGESMWGTIASAAFSNTTSATGECDWLTSHRRMGHVALPMLQQLVKNEMVAGIRVKGEPDEVLGYPTCMQVKFTRYPFSSSEATAKTPLDEVVMDVVGPLKLGAAGAEYFLTIVDPTTLKALLAGAAIKGWVVKQMDVTIAFLNGILEEEIFMMQPEWFDDGSGRVWKLKKALYGLKQAPRQWYLEEIGFTPSSANHSLFMLGEGEQKSFMVVYVDAILIFTPSSDLVKEVMLKLQDKFKCKALGDVSFYLGLHIERDVEKRCMRVHQRKYLEALAANFGQSEGHVATLFPSGFNLMYAAVNTRPDVAFATEQLARVVECPNEEQVAAGMRVAKYLGQTPTVGLQNSAAARRRQKGADGVEPGRLFLTAFSDASYASEPEDMTSVGGFFFCVGGGLTAWESKKQVDQALSSVESEYMALFRAVREIVWQRRLLAELGEEQQGSTPLYCDSQGAIALSKNPVLRGLTKHMRALARVHFRIEDMMNHAGRHRERGGVGVVLHTYALQGGGGMGVAGVGGRVRGGGGEGRRGGRGGRGRVWC